MYQQHRNSYRVFTHPCRIGKKVLSFIQDHQNWQICLKSYGGRLVGLAGKLSCRNFAPWWWCYPNTFVGWGRGGTPRRPNSGPRPRSGLEVKIGRNSAKDGAPERLRCSLNKGMEIVPRSTTSKITKCCITNGAESVIHGDLVSRSCCNIPL